MTSSAPSRRQPAILHINRHSQNHCSLLLACEIKVYLLASSCRDVDVVHTEPKCAGANTFPGPLFPPCRSRQWWEDDEGKEPAAKRTARSGPGAASADPAGKPWWDDGINADDDDNDVGDDPTTAPGAVWVGTYVLEAVCPLFPAAMHDDRVCESKAILLGCQTQTAECEVESDSKRSDQ